MGLIKGTSGKVYVASLGAGASPMTNEATTANVAKTVFTIDDATKRFVDPASVITIDYPDNATPVTDYASFQYPGGIVTWASTPGDGDVFITGKYLPVAEVGEAHGWSLDLPNEFVDTTHFGCTMRENTAVFRAATVSIERFYVDATYFTEMTTAARIRCGFDLFVNYDAGTPANCIRYTGYGVIATRTVNTPVDGVIDEPFTINVTDGPYYVAGLA